MTNIWNVERLHGILDILGIHIIDLIRVIVSVEVRTDRLNSLNSYSKLKMFLEIHQAQKGI